jgi:FkbM family methyltransferase
MRKRVGGGDRRRRKDVPSSSPSVDRVLGKLPGPDLVTFPEDVYGGFTIRVHDDSRDQFVSRAIRGGQWEPFETFCVWHPLRKGSVFYDIGANVGWYTIVGSWRVGRRGRVFAFEPDPDNFTLLWRNVTENGCKNVGLFPMAVADRSGQASLARSPVNMGDHRLDSLKSGRETIPVPVTTLAAIIEAGLPAPDVIKLDTQGSEAKILAPLARLMKVNPRVALATEFWPFGLSQAGSSVEELVAILMSVPLRFYRIDHVSRTLNATDLPSLAGSLSGEDHADLLAVPTEWEPPSGLAGFVR